jgi:predicted RecA/RadA family phage recombinase
VAKNKVQTGDVLNWTNASGSDVSSGDPIVIGNVPAVALVDIDNGDSGSVNRVGVFDLEVEGADDAGDIAVAIGDRLYQETDLTINKKASGKFFGFALETVVSGANTTINVLIGQGATEGNLSGFEIVAAGEATTAGGAAAEDITISGVVATDLCLVTIHTVGSTPRVIVTSLAAAGKITVTFADDPSTDHVVTYIVLRYVG